ncbi:glycerophosphodiester phosphodiesterase [Balneola vulgaris]|uniref:glycerophosphodiester phosphodiesterase n=1 Tax=Balneola vulgaris TaxID=287535 RepID=UPI0003693F0C|nr:glycerophosphodiester phosphodiesterase family protein [Balneola vulgaris]
MDIIKGSWVAILLVTSLSTQVYSQESVTQFNPKVTEISMSDVREQRFIVIAHRGASAYYPENTMPAFKAAVEMNADMIELDVLLSKDNVPVVFHDKYLDKKSNGQGLLSDYTLSELKKLDAGSWFHEKFKGVQIPTLQEVLEFTSGKIALNIEIKTEAVSAENNTIEKSVIDLVERYNLENEVIISSFDYRAIERVKSLNPKIQTALLYERQQSYGREPVDLVKDYKVDAFNFSANECAANWLSQLNTHQIPFFIYTVNDPGMMKSLIEKGAKGIFTDKPDVLYKVADEVLNKNWR